MTWRWYIHVSLLLLVIIPYQEPAYQLYDHKNQHHDFQEETNTAAGGGKKAKTAAKWSIIFDNNQGIRNLPLFRSLKDKPNWVSIPGRNGHLTYSTNNRGNDHQPFQMGKGLIAPKVSRANWRKNKMLTVGKHQSSMISLSNKRQSNLKLGLGSNAGFPWFGPNQWTSM